MAKTTMIIAGGRKYNVDAIDKRLICEVISLLNITLVVHGDAQGADRGGAAVVKNIPFVEVKPFPADWNKLGNAAGPIRNGEMSKVAHVLMTFPGGKGTANMVKQFDGYEFLTFPFKGVKIYLKNDEKSALMEFLTGESSDKN